MTTTGSTLFNMDFTEIAEEAWERAGREMRSGYDLRTARRSFNLMTIEWQNKGINMWTIDEGYINLIQGQATYDLPADTIDLMEHVIRTGAGNVSTQADLSITRISVSTYATIPNKLQQARPIQVWIQRLSGETNPTNSVLDGALTSTATTITLNTVVGLAGAGFIRLGTEDIYYTYVSGNTLGGVFRGQNNTTAAAQADGTAVFVPQLPAVTVWPTPDNSTTYQFVYWRLRRVQDAGAGASGKIAIAECDRCGQQFRLKNLKTEIIKQRKYELLVCPECWDPDQPQLMLGTFPVDDPQALRNPRRDTTYVTSGINSNGNLSGGSRDIQWGWAPVGGASLNDAGLTPNYLVATTFVGTVTVS